MYTDVLLGVVILLFLYIYYVFKKTYAYFDQNGIPYLKPNFIFGNTMDWILMRKPLPVVHWELYEQLEPHRFAGVFASLKKTIMIRDPNLIRNILTKDFEHFYDRGIKRDPHVDKLSQNLFMLTGERWKNLRIKLTSTFTTGKMKMMFPLVEKCGTTLNQVIRDISSNEKFDVKDICARYTTDVIGNCAFGLEIDSLNHPHSEFRKMGIRMLQFKFRFVIRTIFPKFVRHFKSYFFDREVEDFFSNLVQDTIKYREEHNVNRGDFLDLLIALKNQTYSKYDDKHDEKDLQQFLSQVGEKQNKSDIDITIDIMKAQCFLFFFAGFETSSSTLGFMLFELARNQHVQDKVRKEINSVLEKNNNSLTYDTLKELKYLEMVILETLRNYPIAGNLIRECTKTYKIPDSKVTLKQGTAVVISVMGIHHNEKYYEKPNEFYPEHFTEEAKAKRPHYTFLPFGEGPRVCIGERFAMMQIKVAAVNLLRNFAYHISPRMKLPPELVPGFLINDFKGGIWLKCEKL